RGEITLGGTAQSPEKTIYPGSHYVECYAVENNVCTAKDRIIVKII
ncbi:nucleotidyltransferase, partial [candidate division WWE3 bacterium CG22_combo_CG10-13_8_21_14_all_39_12]